MSAGTFLILTASFHLLTEVLRLPGLFIAEISLNYFIYLAMLIFGLVLLHKRSGRSFRFFKKS